MPFFVTGVLPCFFPGKTQFAAGLGSAAARFALAGPQPAEGLQAAGSTIWSRTSSDVTRSMTPVTTN